MKFGVRVWSLSGVYGASVAYVSPSALSSADVARLMIGCFAHAVIAASMPPINKTGKLLDNSVLNVSTVRDIIHQYDLIDQRKGLPVCSDRYSKYHH